MSTDADNKIFHPISATLWQIYEFQNDCNVIKIEKARAHNVCENFKLNC